MIILCLIKYDEKSKTFDTITLTLKASICIQHIWIFHCGLHFLFKPFNHAYLIINHRITWSIDACMLMTLTFRKIMLTNTIQTCLDRKRRHPSPLSSGSSSCQRLEEPHQQQCEGRPCPGCHQTLQQWRQFQAVWWPHQISASLQQCLQSAIQYFNINQQHGHQHVCVVKVKCICSLTTKIRLLD